jgi:hypothetical protein
VELREVIEMLPAAFLISTILWKGAFREIEQIIGFVPFLVDLMQDGEPILIFVILEELAAALSSEAETDATGLHDTLFDTSMLFAISQIAEISPQIAASA